MKTILYSWMNVVNDKDDDECVKRKNVMWANDKWKSSWAECHIYKITMNDKDVDNSSLGQGSRSSLSNYVYCTDYCYGDYHSIAKYTFHVREYVSERICVTE